MPQVPSTRWTVLDVLSTARELAKTVDQKKVITEQGKYFYKVALSEIVTLLNSSLDPSYHVPTPLTLAADIERLSDSTITAINSTAKTITRSSGTFIVGSYLHITLITIVGAVIAYQWTARIVVGGSTATYEVITGTDATYASATQHCSVFVEKSNSTNPLSVDISTVNYDRIVAIEDSVNGQCVEVSPHEFASLVRTGFAHKSYDDDIVFCQYGNTLRFRNGSKIVPGTKTMWYQRQPDYPDNWDDTDWVDLADKWIPLLIQKIYVLMILQVENDVPKNLQAEMQMNYQQISGFLQAEMSNKTKDSLQANFLPKKQ